MKLKIIPIGQYEPQHHERAKMLAEKYGYELKYHEVEMGDPGILELCRGAHILIVTPRLPVDILPVLENCRLIALESTGFDCVDIQRAKEMGITVSNVPDYCANDVSERVYALMLALAQQVVPGHQTVLNDQWDSPISQISTSLTGKTLGLFGMGKIGQRIAEKAKAFGLKLIAHTANPDPERAAKYYLKWVDFDELVAQSDFIALAVPATPENHQKFNADAFRKMKKSARIINTARGSLIDEQALAEALNNGEIAGAALDVFQQEPINRDNPLLGAPNLILTPHTAFASDVSLDRLHQMTLDNVEAFLGGNPQNVVNR